MKALRYLQLHPVLPDDTPEATATEWKALKTSVQLNASLAALKVTPPQPKVAIAQTTAVIQNLAENKTAWDSDEEAAKKSTADLAKAYYRRALGYVAIKDEERAETDLKRADELTKGGDAGVKKELHALQKRMEAKVKAQRAAYSKMFS